MLKLLPILLLLKTSFAWGQDTKNISSLDRFFGGIPLQQKYGDWVLYVVANYSIDSTYPDRIHSSFKADTKDRFPFPDAIPVKILLYTGLKNVESARISDTSKGVVIAGFFGTGKTSKKKAYSFLKELRSVLKVYYKKENNLGTNWGYSEGVNANFPDASLSINSGHPPANNGYSVVLRYHHDNWIKY
ncbi:MAG TPA: hypothetical protein VGO58_20510 [Chitinophagaceae bacterium]|jgi:hypothetical protein|nr:hypothetical protein [Chitinophagaceae bacterium]